MWWKKFLKEEYPSFAAPIANVQLFRHICCYETETQKLITSVWLFNRISPDIRSLVYRYGILNGGVSDWEFMLQRYVDEDVAGEKTNLLRGLASTEDIVLINR